MTVPRVYATEHIHSRVICNAFAEGCGGQIVPPVKLLDGPAAMYGILRGTGDIMKKCQWVGRDFYYIDIGYFRPGHYGGYYRVTQNGMQKIFGPFENKGRTDRWEALNITIAPWRKTGRHILVCPLSGFVGSFLNIDPREWTRTVVNELSLYTDRPIIIRPKNPKLASVHSSNIQNPSGFPVTDLEESLQDCWCLVTHSSKVAIEALIIGVPVIVLGESAAKPVSWSLEHIEKPIWPVREWWANELAYNQWTLDEMRNGTAWDMINGRDTDIHRVRHTGKDSV